jgi:hypothetical protein
MASALISLRNQIREKCTELEGYTVLNVFNPVNWLDYACPFIYVGYEDKLVYELDDTKAQYEDSSIGSSGMVNVLLYFLIGYSVGTDTTDCDLLGDAAENSRDTVMKLFRGWEADFFRSENEQASINPLIPVESFRYMVSPDMTKGYSVLKFSTQLESNYY